MTTASAPASSANLGPGFDIIALALDLRCTVTATPSDAWRVTSSGEPASSVTVEMVRDVAPTAQPHVVDIVSSIPPARGLGSSAAVLVAASAAIRGDADPEATFAAAARVEGHPDNVAAAVFGGLVVVGPDATIHRAAIHPSLCVVAAVPEEELSTADARGALAEVVDRGVAVRTAARLALLLEGLRMADEAALRAALGDEIHEAPRRAITDLPASLIDAALDSGALYASWSGAGPSVVAFVEESNSEAVVDGMASVPASGEVVELMIDREGVRIE